MDLRETFVKAKVQYTFLPFLRVKCLRFVARWHGAKESFLKYWYNDELTNFTGIFKYIFRKTENFQLLPNGIIHLVRTQNIPKN